ncbi:MAG: 4Fe-4S dicluster domain-containing protein [Clostridiales bacterium]|jgi:epoxyqueuosine reductase QueG|nr:4Fe-4S dicluster domain-containing protein [Clostridiales bacterium]MDR2713316.1 4Fe-4S dicluster domain-containing protein [Clostridiales bacterium]
MSDLNEHIREQLLDQGADIVGFADLSQVPPDARANLPRGISVAVKYPKEIIRGISELPTPEYYHWYSLLNERLDNLVAFGAKALEELGYQAIAQTRAHVGGGETEYSTLLPHKTVATRANLGWIGKCALLITEKYGSMIRLSSILTNAPLATAEPVNRSRCGDCQKCREACPGRAVSGREWQLGLAREEFFDAPACRKTARERARIGFGGGATICGKCIEICPYTRKYLQEL